MILEDFETISSTPFPPPILFRQQFVNLGSHDDEHEEHEHEH